MRNIIHIKKHVSKVEFIGLGEKFTTQGIECCKLQ